MLLRKFKNCSSNVKKKLFNSYIGSFYGIHLWEHYSTTFFDKMKVAYNNTFRFLFGIKRRESVSGAMLSTGIKPFIVAYRKRICSFRKRVFNNHNKLVKYLVNSMYFLSIANILHKWDEHLLC